MLPYLATKPRAARRPAPAAPVVLPVEVFKGCEVLMFLFLLIVGRRAL